MVKSIIIHIGDRKAGSTSIQRTLAHKGWSCDTVSLFQPKPINHGPLAKALATPDDHEQQEIQFARLIPRLQESNADIGVISAEAFEDVDPEVMKQVLSKYMPEHMADLRVIAYVRPHAERILSSWAQQIKMGMFSGSLRAFYNKTSAKGRFLYHDRFSAWREVFGGQFTLRPMIRDTLYQQSAVADFFHFALQTTDFTLNEDKSNASLSIEDLTLLKAVQEIYSQSHKHRNLQAALGDGMAQILSRFPPRPTQTKPRMEKELVQDVVATYLEDAQNLDAKFFTGSPITNALHGAIDKAIDAPQIITPETYFSAHELRSIQALAHLITTLASTNVLQQTKNLRRKLDSGTIQPKGN